MAKQLYVLLAGASLFGGFTNKTDLKAAKAEAGDESTVITNPNELYEALSETQMRQLRARLAVPANSADIEMDAQNLFQNDERFNTKAKKMATAQKLWDELAAFYGQPVSTDAKPPKEPAAPKEPKAPRGNIKQHIRDLFPNVGDTRTLGELAGYGAEGEAAKYSDVSIGTALSDLRSEKYAGAGGVLVVKRQKAEDGTISYVRES